MPSDDLSLFSYEVLSLVGEGGAGAHDLARMVQRGRMLAWAGESQYYVEPKRLARLGYLAARREPGRTRERTVYELTEQGREALVAWARTPVHFQAFKSELLLRVMVTDLVGEDTVRNSVGTLRDDIADLRARLDEGVASAEQLPHRRKYLLMVNERLRELLDLHLRWVDEIERELRPGDA